jgi:type IV secretory pathway VirB10-like protein
MQITRTTIGIVAIVSLAAGAFGALIATRAGRTEAASGPAAPLTTGPAVEESEGVVAPAPAVPPRPTDAHPSAPVAARPAPVAHAAPAPRGRGERRRARTDRAGGPGTARDAGAASGRHPRVVEVAPAPPEPRFEDLQLAAQSVIGLQLETSVTSETARVEDEVIAHVTRDVRVGDRVAIPAGSKAHGEVTLVERGARVRERARLGVRFTSIVLADGTRLPIDTEPIYREGETVRNENAAKIGGGASAAHHRRHPRRRQGCGDRRRARRRRRHRRGGGGWRNAATLPSGAPVTVRIERPVTVSVER